MTPLSKQRILHLVKPAAIVFLLLLFWNLGVSTARGTETALEALQADIRHYNLRWTPGETALSRLSSEEKQRRAGGLKTPPERIDPDQIWQKPERDRAIEGYPLSYNLWDVGMITPVRDQESCGSCWAFAAAANLEALLSQAGQGSQDLSEQENSWGTSWGQSGLFYIKTQDSAIGTYAIGASVAVSSPSYLLWTK